MQKNGVWRCSLSVFQRENSDYFFAAFKVVLCNFYPALFENTLSEPTIRPSIHAEKKHLNYPLQFSIDVERAVALCSAGAVPCGVWNNCAGGRASICAMGQGCDMGNFPKSRFRGAS